MDYFKNFLFIEQDINARSLSFYCKEEIIAINGPIISELRRAVTDGNRVARISLHSSPQSELHNMIICQQKGVYHRPHKHLLKAESHQILEGEMVTFIFDDNGVILHKCEMAPGENLIFRLEKNHYHISLAVSDYVIFHESKTGPFVREHDAVYAEWAPETGETKRINEFIKRLLQNE